MLVSVFGNPDLKEDSLVVGLVPQLRRQFPGVEFRIEDPSEGLAPPEDDLWVIVDVAGGIDGVKVLDDLERLDSLRRASVHDYDLAMELKLLAKLGRLKKFKIIAVPVGMRQNDALQGIIKVLQEISNSS